MHPNDSNVDDISRLYFASLSSSGVTLKWKKLMIFVTLFMQLLHPRGSPAVQVLLMAEVLKEKLPVWSIKSHLHEGRGHQPITMAS